MAKRSTVERSGAGWEAQPSAEAGDSADAQAELQAAVRWQAAEARLYPIVMVDADLYESAVTLVREVADVLRSRCDTVGGLSEVDSAAVLAECPSAAGMAALGFDPRVAFDAACASRWREMSANQPRLGSGPTLDGQR